MVEWKTVGEIIAVHTGKQLNRNDLTEVGTYPVINGGRTPSGYTDSFNEPQNSITISQGGESAGFVNWIDKPFWAGAHCYVVENFSAQNIRFLYHLLKAYEYIIMESKQGAGIPGLNRKNLYSLSIPVPSIAEQERIVSILDTFTASIDNLKEQIAQRRKQFEFYRDQLLDLEGKDGVEMKKLEDIVSNDCSLSYGIVQPGDDVEGGVPVVRPVDLTSTYVYRDGLKRTESSISESYKRTILVGNEILFCVRGTTGIMGLATSDLKGCNVTRGIVPIKFDNEGLKKFVYYQMKSYRLQKLVEEKTNGTALKQINIKDLRLLTICLPPTSEQQRIVSILDTFEASITNLEAQLAQRQKQYEYYRNQLLTFEGG